MAPSNSEPSSEPSAVVDLKVGDRARSGPPSSARTYARWQRLDRIALGGIALGLALYVLPLPGGWSLRAGFWLTLLSTLFHIYTSSTRPSASSSPEPK